ncbi:hypothetical protein B2G71_01960 [Novosphingobium sp. PC22D]|nr:hypothetical protein B2G71_01960 [Novosphingobium sp. PC22D]
MRVVRKLKSVETGLDELLAQAADLMAQISRARVSDDRSMLEGQRPIARIASMQQNLVEARSDIVRVHADLAKILAGTKDIPTNCPQQAFYGPEDVTSAA